MYIIRTTDIAGNEAPHHLRYKMMDIKMSLTEERERRRKSKGSELYQFYVKYLNCLTCLQFQLKVQYLVSACHHKNFFPRLGRTQF